MIWTLLQWYFSISLACLLGTILVAVWDRNQWLAHSKSDTPPLGTIVPPLLTLTTTEPSARTQPEAPATAPAPTPTPSSAVAMSGFSLLSVPPRDDLGSSEHDFIAISPVTH
jgi:hypothetical protein